MIEASRLRSEQIATIKIHSFYFENDTWIYVFFLAGFLKKDRDLEGIDRVVDEYDETVTSVFLQEFMDFFIKEKKEIRDCRGQNQDKNSFHPLFSIFNDRSTRTHNTSLSI